MAAGDDILAEWKRRRFVVADYELLVEPEIVIVLTDISFWTKNADELMEWCKINGGDVAGMTVTFKNNEQLTMFALRWS